VLTEREVHADGEPSLGDICEALAGVYGTDFGIHDPGWISRFTDMTRQAAAYRDRRVLLAGDAAHVHPPVGGQGLNLGVQDAVNLGWKLALVVKGRTPDGLLDSYHVERHAVGARVLRNTMAQVVLGRVDERSKALSAVMVELLGGDEARRRFAAEMCGLAIRYDFGNGHPLLGQRMPDLDLATTGGVLRAFSLLHEARAVLLDFGTRGGIDIGAWADRVRCVDARCDGPWELPAIGAVPAPAAVLVRPDGYVAWVGDGTQDGLADALARWCGAKVA
jgi:3-(3-hydroxy-phenyl)propionate hydroxylase